MSESFVTLYESMGGAETISRLVDAFYNRVAVHPELKPLFPDDFTEVRRRQYMFLTQFFGGPPLYTEEFGHPMLRARHMSFPITPSRAKAWLSCMSAAMDEVGLSDEIREQAFARLTMTAYHMVNTAE
jgi:hemoglobin